MTALLWFNRHLKSPMISLYSSDCLAVSFLSLFPHRLTKLLPCVLRCTISRKQYTRTRANWKGLEKIIRFRYAEELSLILNTHTKNKTKQKMSSCCKSFGMFSREAAPKITSSGEPSRAWSATST